jgi:alpha-galactosidase
MANKKIVCLGAGSLYFPRALGDLVLQQDLAGAEIALYDLDPEKARRMAALGQRLARSAGSGVSVRVAGELADALDGADFAISSIGGSGAEITRNVYGSYYHSADLHIPARYGIHQIIGDTCGPAGMMMALRSIPAYLRICREMERRCPRAILFNHSNPMAPLCRAAGKYTDIQMVGICHGVQATVRRAAELLELPPSSLDCVWIGTNHYYWLIRVACQGRDLLPELARRIEARIERGEQSLPLLLSAAYGYCVGYPGASHLIEFYPYLAQVRSQEELPYGMAREARDFGFDERQPMPARPVATDELRTLFFAQYQELLDRVELPPIDRSDWTAAEGVADLIAAIARGRREVYVVNLPNQGIVPNLPAEAVLEVEGITDSTGIRGIQVGNCPLVLKGLLEKRVAWQELVVDAAVSGDRRLALQALLLDEMSIRPELARPMLDELLAASRDLLPQFVG